MYERITKFRVRAVRRYLERWGWIKGQNFRPDGSACLSGACQKTGLSAHFFYMFLRDLQLVHGPGSPGFGSTLWMWNDHPSRTFEHVRDLLLYAEQQAPDA